MSADTTRLRRAPGQPPFLLGHRGVRGLGSGTPVENTLEAFAMAKEAGADGIELDVRTCATGELVVFHDPTLARMTQGADARQVSQLSFDELRRVDIGGGLRIPLLDDVLTWAGDLELIVNVEMKSDVPNRQQVISAVSRALGRHDNHDRHGNHGRDGLGSRSTGHRTSAIIVSSFDPLMLARFALGNRQVVCGLLFHRGQWRPLRSGWLAPLLGAEAVHPDHVLVDERTIAAWKGSRQSAALARERPGPSRGRREYLVNVWTVNDVTEAARLAALGVDAIMTDDPARIGRALRGAALEHRDG